MGTNAVLGLIENYGVGPISPFVRSLRETGFQGDIVFFTRNIPADAHVFLQEMNVINRQYERFQFRRIKKVRRAINFSTRTVRFLLGDGRVPFQEKLVRYFWHCQASRFLYYLEFLKNCVTKYDQILLADVRDVFFQSDPFVGGLKGVVQVFEEHPIMSIKDESHNRDWILDMFGGETLAEIGHFPIICSGVSMGTHDGMAAYLEKMVELIGKRHGRNCGFDQGVHNYIVRKDFVPGIHVYPYGEGPVMHLGIAPVEEMVLSDDGKVLDRSGNICPVVHQYDRHAAILDRINADYGVE